MQTFIERMRLNSHEMCDIIFIWDEGWYITDFPNWVGWYINMMIHDDIEIES